jgi:hyperosmotically inducible protein
MEDLMRKTKWHLGATRAATGAMLWLALCAVAGGADTPHSDSLGAAVSDTAITAKVKSKFIGEEQLRGSDINVVTTNGVVTLTGRATGADAKAAAETLARDVRGVKSVDDQLIATDSDNAAHRELAKAEKVGSDGWITTKVKSELEADDVGRGLALSVHTRNGVVHIAGAVPNRDAAAHVKDLAEKIEGVKSVDTGGLSVTSR